MTWEFVVLICFTQFILAAVWFHKSQHVTQEISPDEFEMLKAAVASQKADQEAIHKLAEETKKLLSQQSLAQSLRPQR